MKINLMNNVKLVYSERRSYFMNYDEYTQS